MVVKIQVKVLWVVTASNVPIGYQCYGGSYCFHHQDEVNGTGEKGNLLKQDMASQPR
jgi:hypothetical protein